MKLAQADMRGAHAVDGEGEELGDLTAIAERLASRLIDADTTVVPDVPPDLSRLAMADAALATVLAILMENARQAGATHLALAA